MLHLVALPFLCSSSWNRSLDFAWLSRLWQFWRLLKQIRKNLSFFKLDLGYISLHLGYISQKWCGLPLLSFLTNPPIVFNPSSSSTIPSSLWCSSLPTLALTLHFRPLSHLPTPYKLLLLFLSSSTFCHSLSLCTVCINNLFVLLDVWYPALSCPSL